MSMPRLLVLAAIAVIAVGPVARAQEPAKPGPEHELLKKWEGTWDSTMKMAGGESKGVTKYKMDLGGQWLISKFEGKLGDADFSGMGHDSYDAAKKKYVGIWIDSMSASPMIFEGTFDKEKKTLTMSGEGPGPDGKSAKYKYTSVWKDDDTVDYTMYMGDAKEPLFTIAYKRKK
jgi:Protein of unknown function (DUF1579)